MPVRISFFQYVASTIEPFLKFIQYDKPLSSFFYQELEKIIYSLLEMFIKPEVVAVNKSVFKMMKLGLNANRVHYKNVKIGIATTSLLNKLKQMRVQKFNLEGNVLIFSLELFISYSISLLEQYHR